LLIFYFSLGLYLQMFVSRFFKIHEIFLMPPFCIGVYRAIRFVAQQMGLHVCQMFLNSIRHPENLQVAFLPIVGGHGTSIQIN
jgi:hypothetical protein